MIIPIYILHLLLIYQLTISADVVLDIPLNLIRNKIIKYDKGKELFIVEKASYNNPNDLLNQRSEILNAYRYKIVWLLGKYNVGLVEGFYANFLFLLVAALLIKCCSDQPSFIRFILMIR